MTPPEALAAVLAELDAAAVNAARRNKPTMWAYYLDVAGQLRRLIRREAEIVESCRTVIEIADELAANPTTQAAYAARWWSTSVYARRILRMSGERVSRPSLAWLRARVAP